jgi:hypothetical protein
MRCFGQLTARLLLLASLSWACSPIRFTSQDVLLKHDQKHDVLDVLILYNEIESGRGTSKPGEESDTDKFTSHVISGKREFMLFDWPLQVDLDELAANPIRSGPWGDWQREGVDLLGGISVERAGVFHSEKGWPSLFQHFRIKKASRLIAWLDQSLRLSIEDKMKEGTFEKDTPWFDARTRDLLADLVKEKKRWLTLQAGVLTVDLPVTSPCAARVFAELMKHCGNQKEDGRFLTCLSAPISEITVNAESTRLSWGKQGTPLSFRYEVGGQFDPWYAESVMGSAGFPKNLPSKDEVVAKFEAR